jgi:hypothetical protein
LRFRTLLCAHVKLAKYGLLRHPVLSLFAHGKLTAYEHQFFASLHGIKRVMLRLSASICDRLLTTIR